MQTRKQFLFSTLSFVSGTTILARNLFDKSVQQTPDVFSPTFDLHSHVGRLFAIDKTDPEKFTGANKTLGEMNGVRLSGAFFSLVADNKIIKAGPTGIQATRKFEPNEAWEDYKSQLKNMKDFFETASVRQATHASDLKKSDSVAAFIAVEGGDFLEGKVERLDDVYDDGIRSIQLVHYAPNDIGDLQTADPVNNGLSSFGKDVVRKMNKLGIVIDVAHATYHTVKDVAGLSDSPIMLSHSILEMEPDRPIAKRAISKEHAKVVAQTGGLIGAWPSGFNKNFEEFVDNTLRLVDVVGIDHVGIGTDMDSNFKPVLSSYAQYPLFADALKNKGLSQAEVEKIMGGNASVLLNKVYKEKK